MASHVLPGIGLSGGRSAGESGWADEMNLNLLKLSAVARLSVKSRVTALPGSPTDGDIYIVPSGGDANKVAIRDAGAWTYLTPTEGWQAWVNDEDVTVTWSGSAWLREQQPVDVGTYISGVPTASEVVLGYVFTRAVTFPDDFAGSQSTAGVAATASTTFAVKKNGSSVGTLVFSAAGSTGAFLTSGGSTSFAAGDLLELVAPASPDATLANVRVTFMGVR